MMAWATVVAERIGFRREEALSIGMQTSLLFCGPTYPASSICLYGDERSDKGNFPRNIRRSQRAGDGGGQGRFSVLRRAHGQTVRPFKLSSIHLIRCSRRVYAHFPFLFFTSQQIGFSDRFTELRQINGVLCQTATLYLRPLHSHTSPVHFAKQHLISSEL